MSDITNKEWETGDIIEATDLNAITPFMFSLVYNEQSERYETSATVQEILDALAAHYLGFAVNIDTESFGYSCLIVLEMGYNENTDKFSITLYGSNDGNIDTVEMTASGLDGKFHTTSSGPIT